MTKYNVSPMMCYICLNSAVRSGQLILCWEVREAYSQILSFYRESKKHTDNHYLIH